MGDSSLGGMRDESFMRQQMDLQFLEDAPSGLSLAERKVEEIGRGNYPNTEKRAGSLAALQRYQDILQLAQRLAPR